MRDYSSGSKRQLRVASTIKKSLYNIFLRKVSLGVVVSISDVNVSSDLRYVKVLVSSVVDDKDVVMKKMNTVMPNIRMHLYKAISNMRYMPEIVFHYDDGLKNIMRVNEILSESAA